MLSWNRRYNITEKLAVITWQPQQREKCEDEANSDQTLAVQRQSLWYTSSTYLYTRNIATHLSLDRGEAIAGHGTVTLWSSLAPSQTHMQTIFSVLSFLVLPAGCGRQVSPAFLTNWKSTIYSCCQRPKPFPWPSAAGLHKSHPKLQKYQLSQCFLEDVRNSENLPMLLSLLGFCSLKEHLVSWKGIFTHFFNCFLVLKFHAAVGWVSPSVVSSFCRIMLKKLWQSCLGF